MIWKIRLEPRDPELLGGTLEILAEGSDQLDAEDALDGWRLTFQQYGRIPRGSMDFESESGIAVISRRGRLAWYCRADCYERETENGSTVGACVLVAREYPDDD